MPTWCGDRPVEHKPDVARESWGEWAAENPLAEDGTDAAGSPAMHQIARLLTEWFSWESWMREVRWAGRRLGRAPGYSLAVVGSLVLCLGPNAAIFAALQALVLRPLPFPAPEQLVVVNNVAEKSAGQTLAGSLSQYADFRDHADLFAGFAVVRRTHGWMEGTVEPERLAVDSVTPNYFDLLGVTPLRGRFFRAEEGTTGRNQVLVLSEAYWESRYQADPDVIGRQVRWEGQLCTIIGIAPRSLAVLRRQTCFFQPYAAAAARFDATLRYRGDVTLYGRLRAGVNLAGGREQLQRLEAAFLSTTAPASIRAYAERAGFKIELGRLHVGGEGGGGAARMLWLLQASALLVLLIGAVNVVNLALVRLSARREELAMRRALGAGRAAVWRQGLAESGWLMAVGGLAAGGSCLGGLRLLNTYLPLLVPTAPEVTVSGAIVGGVALGLVGFAMGLATLPLTCGGWADGRLRGGRTVTANRQSRFGRRVLVMSQVALAMVLLVAASLLVRSWRKVQAIDPGFAADQVITARISLPANYAPTAPLAERYADPNAAANVGLQQRIMAALGEVPGVTGVTQALESVVNPDLRPVPFGLGGEADAIGEKAGASGRLIHLAAVGPDFATTLGLQLREGRDFGAGDGFATAPVAIVDATFARRYFPGENVIGREIGLSKGLPLAEEGWARIVGVVSRAEFTGLDRADGLPLVYVPMVGFPVKRFDVLVRTSRAAPEVIGDMRARLRGVDPGLLLTGAATLQADLDDLLTGRRGITVLLGWFAGVALVLAAIGLYGVLAFDVAQRRREFGIRGALGATRRQLVGMVIRQGAVDVGLGAAGGLVGAVLLSRFLQAWLFGLTALDPVAYAFGSVVLALVGFLACWWPAWQAARVDPMLALRSE